MRVTENICQLNPASPSLLKGYFLKLSIVFGFWDKCISAYTYWRQSYALRQVSTLLSNFLDQLQNVNTKLPTTTHCFPGMRQRWPTRTQNRKIFLYSNKHELNKDIPDYTHSQLARIELCLTCQLSVLWKGRELTIFSLYANNKSSLGFLCGIYLFLREINMEKACRDFHRKGWEKNTVCARAWC